MNLIEIGPWLFSIPVVYRGNPNQPVPPYSVALCSLPAPEIGCGLLAGDIG